MYILYVLQYAPLNDLYLFTRYAYCSLPSQIKPILDMLDDLQASPQTNDVTDLTKYIGEMNRIRSKAQQAVAMLSAIPDTENDDSVAALAWGDAKQEYIDTIESHLDEIRGLIEDAQEKRADLQGVNLPESESEPQAEDEDEEEPEPEPEPEEEEPAPEPSDEPAEEQEPEEEEPAVQEVPEPEASEDDTEVAAETLRSE